MQGDACNIYPQFKQNLHNTVEPRNIFPIAQVFCALCMHTAQAQCTAHVERAQAVGAKKPLWGLCQRGSCLDNAM